MVHNPRVKYVLGIAQTYNWLQAPHMLQRASARGGDKKSTSRLTAARAIHDDMTVSQNPGTLAVHIP